MHAMMALVMLLSVLSFAHGHVEDARMNLFEREYKNIMAENEAATNLTKDYSYKKTVINVGGFVGGSYQDAVLYWPEGEPQGHPFRLISFSHGMTAGGTGTESLYLTEFQRLAAAGFVVIAPRSCPSIYCVNVWRDQLRAIEFARESSHEAFKYVDFSRVGITGHSMGGHATVHSASLGYTSTAQKLNVVAAVAQHPAVYNCIGCAPQTKIPMMYVTGSADTVTPASTAKTAYTSTPTSKAYLSLSGASHYEPNYLTNRWPSWLIGWFSCQLNMDEAGCSVIVNACQSGPSTGRWAECKVDQFLPPVDVPELPEEPELFACSQCVSYGYGSDGCNCGHCGSFGACTFSCDPSSSFYTGRVCNATVV